MRWDVIVFYNSSALALNGFFMLVSALIGLNYGDGSAAILLVSGIITVGFGTFPTIFIPRARTITLRESIAVVALGWLSCTLAGSIPYYLYGPPFSIVNSIFESISGYTTTGASILASVEDLPHGILFWRACTEWLGGIGIISFALAVMPRMGQVSRPFLQQEYTGLVVQPVQARASDIVRGLFAVYFGLTAAQALLLALTGQPWFDAVTNALATLPTGGFSVRNASFATYNNVMAEVITIVFMLIGGMNFVFLHFLLTKPKKLSQGFTVVTYYLVGILTTVLLVTIILKGSHYSGWLQALRFGSFQVISVATTTGFGSADSAIWPVPAQIAILLITLIGACNGSTGGGIKWDRVALFVRLMKFRFQQMIHPSLVASIRMDGKFVNLDIAEKSLFYVLPYIVVLGITTLLLILLGMSSIDAFSGTTACLANAGPGMGSVGSMGNYSAIPETAKVILSFVMLFGRLEMFALILPFTPGFWRS